ncbi:L domain-like protein [Fistulina hepatica ATCC 64428]|uniref:L domain-like protein n=1 Tax=Fistulina hepatica ATCC 64428 TaxID=1128425 RepID=A0A0D7API3_9AGAR|nr:L domain-like protein [Fistulina hepatica ATCC 64428]
MPRESSRRVVSGASEGVASRVVYVTSQPDEDGFGAEVGDGFDPDLTRGNATILTQASFRLTVDKLVTALTDVEPWEPYWEDLSVLDLRDKGLEGVVKLKDMCPKLGEVGLNNNHLCYLTGVPTTVRILHAARNKLTSLTSYAHLTRLEHLDINGNEVDSLGHLGALKRLRTLKASGNQIESVDGICHSAELVRLELAGNHISCIDFEKCEWPKLELLDISRNRISEVRNLREDILPRLTLLNLDNNCLSVLHFDLPRCFASLRVLRVSYNNLTSLDVGLLTNLKTFYADGNRFGEGSKSSKSSALEGTPPNKAITNLHKLTRLENFSARGKGRLYLEGRDLRDTRRIYLSGTILSTSLFTDACYNLVYLELAACRLTSSTATAPAATGDPSTGLAPRDSNLTVLPPLFRFTPNVRVLNLNYNFLENLQALHELRRVRKLTVVANRVKGSKELVRLTKEMPDLELCDFRMNPCTLGWYFPLLQLGGRSDEPGADPRIHVDDGRASANAQWHDLDQQFRRDLPNDSYVGRLAYRGLIMQSCAELRSLDGVTVTDKERKKASELLAMLSESKAQRAR